MARKIQHKRGLKADLPILDDAELGVTIDTKEVFFGSPDGNQQLAKVDDLPSIANKEVLDRLTDDEGKLKYDGQEVGAVTSVNGQVGDVDGLATETYVDDAINGMPEIDLSPYAKESDLQSHIDNKNNPHNTNKDDVGLGNVDNVKQASKTEFDGHVKQKATTSKEGHVQLSDSTSSTSITQAATSNAVKKAFDRAVGVDSAQVNRLRLNAFAEDTPMSDYPLGYSVFYVQLSSNPWSIANNGFLVVETLKTVNQSWGIQRATNHGNEESREVFYRSIGDNAADVGWGAWKKIITSNNLKQGTGNPEGTVTAPKGTLYLRTDGGTDSTLYIKTNGTGNAGWTAK